MLNNFATYPNMINMGSPIYQDDFSQVQLPGPPMMDYGEEIKRRQNIKKIRDENQNSLYIAYLSENPVPSQPDSSAKNLQELFNQEQSKKKEKIYSCLISLGYSKEVAELAVQSPQVFDEQTALLFIEDNLKIHLDQH